jgi:hypothetical protein
MSANSLISISVSSFEQPVTAGALARSTKIGWKTRLAMRGISRFLFVVVVMSPISACRRNVSEVLTPDSKTTAWFLDVTREAAIHFVHDPGKLGSFFMPESTGSGAAIFDFNGDGMMDVYLIQNAGANSRQTNRLFQQTASGRFEDRSHGSGLDVDGHGMGAAVGDVNNDGKPDVLVTEYGRARLFWNRGDGHFVEVTEQAGIENPNWGTSACFFDYDRDGWLDLAIANYVDYAPTQKCFDQAGNLEYCGPSGFPPTISRLFRNLGSADSPRFQDVTVSAGLSNVPGPALGVVCADFDGDRWCDIFLADDAAKNRLWINQRNGTFAEQAVERGIAYNAMGQTQANMGIAVGDVDGDRQFDIFVTHLNSESHALWSQQPRGVFQDRSGAAGVNRTQWRGTGFGTLFADFNHDGAIDLAQVNGAVKRVKDAPIDPRIGPYWSSYAERNQLLRNDGKGGFTDISAANAAFCGTPNVGRGLACGDLNNDGAMDLLVTCIGGEARLFLNVANDKGNWLLVRAIEPELGGRDSHGAEIIVENGEWRACRWLNPSYSYLCANDPRCHFGLGTHKRVDRIRVLWPDGTEEQFPGTEANQSITLKKGRGLIVESSAGPIQ